MKPKILIVDDEKPLRDTLARWFRPSYDCLVAPDADEAMKLVKANPDLALMITDVRLYKASALRLVAVPLLVLITLFFMPVSFEVKMVMLIAEATPCGAATSMLAQMFGADYQYGTGLVIMTTIFSMITMPLVLTFALQVL